MSKKENNLIHIETIPTSNTELQYMFSYKTNKTSPSQPLQQPKHFLKYIRTLLTTNTKTNTNTNTNTKTNTNTNTNTNNTNTDTNTCVCV